MHNYGLSEVHKLLVDRNIRWEEQELRKKVTLTNVSFCKDKVTVKGIAERLNLGYWGWEIQLAAWLVESIYDSICAGKETANISCMFCCDMYSYDDDNKKIEISQDELIGKLMNLFKVVEDTTEEMRVELIFA